MEKKNMGKMLNLDDMVDGVMRETVTVNSANQQGGKLQLSFGYEGDYKIMTTRSRTDPSSLLFKFSVSFVFKL